MADEDKKTPGAWDFVRERLGEYLPKEMTETEPSLIPPDYIPPVLGTPPKYIAGPGSKPGNPDTSVITGSQSSGGASGPDMSVKDGDKPLTVPEERGNVEDITGNFNAGEEIDRHYRFSFGNAPQGPAANVVSLHDYNQSGGRKYIDAASDPTAIKAGVSQGAVADDDEGKQLSDVYSRMQQKGEDQLAAIRSDREAFNQSVAKRQEQIDAQTQEYTRNLADGQAFWKSPGNVIAAIGMALMPLAGAGGDSGVKLIRQAVEADWRDRKALADSSMGHLKSNLAGYRDIMADKVAGDYLGLAESYKVASLELQRISSSIKGEKSKAQAAILIGQLDQQAAEAQRQANIHAYMRPQAMNGQIEAAYRRSPEAEFIGDKKRPQPGVATGAIPGAQAAPGRALGGGGGVPSAGGPSAAKTEAEASGDVQLSGNGSWADLAASALKKTDPKYRGKPGAPGKEADFPELEERAGKGMSKILTDYDDQYTQDLVNRFMTEATPAEKASGSPILGRKPNGQLILAPTPAGQKLGQIIIDETKTKPAKIIGEIKKDTNFVLNRQMQNLISDMNTLEVAMGGPEAAKRAIPAAYLLGQSAEGALSTWEGVKAQLFKQDPNMAADEKKVAYYRSLFTRLSAANNEDMKRVLGAISTGDRQSANATGQLNGDWGAAMSKARELSKNSQGALVEALTPALTGGSVAHRIAALEILKTIGARPYGVNAKGQGVQK